MGFSGGGSNILKPHTHDSAILQDGGGLRFDGITQSGMSAGSMTFSDSNNLQELALTGAGALIQGNAAATAPAYLTLSATPNDQLRSTGTQIEWFTPASSATVLWEQLDRHLSTTNESTYTYTPGSALDLDTTYNSILITGHGLADASLNLQCKISGLTEYHTSFNQNVSGTLTGGHDGSATEIDLVNSSLINSSRNFNYFMYISKAKYDATQENNSYWGWGQALTRGFVTFAGGTVAGANHDITSIEIKTSTSTWDDGTLLEVYGLKQS